MSAPIFGVSFKNLLGVQLQLLEGILKNKAKNLDLIIDSAGTANYHVGKKPDIRSIEIAKKHDIDIKNQIARQFTKNDFINFDVIYAMDKKNYHDISGEWSH